MPVRAAPDPDAPPGDPNCKAPPLWEPYGLARRQAMLFEKVPFVLAGT
jgi:hypothetical protein